jgi:hypothetical protein
VSDERLTALRAAKLEALVRSSVSSSVFFEPHPFPGGAALCSGDDTWVLVEDAPHRSCGYVLAWASRREDLRVVNIVLERDAGVVARQASYFRSDVRVWEVIDRSMRRSAPQPFSAVKTLSFDPSPFLDQMKAVGVEPVVEWGELWGEVAGLEVCRVYVNDDVSVLRVGVGRQDQEMSSLIHGDAPPLDVLQRVVDAALFHRRLEVPTHAMNRFARERLLRSLLCVHPESAGWTSLQPAEPPIQKLGLRESTPCVATGFNDDGKAITAVFSTGIDLQLVPFAADAHALHGGELHVVVPQIDILPTTKRLFALLRNPANLHPFELLVS